MLIVRGKGGKERMVLLSAPRHAAAAALAAPPREPLAVRRAATRARP